MWVLYRIFHKLLTTRKHNKKRRAGKLLPTLPVLALLVPEGEFLAQLTVLLALDDALELFPRLAVAESEHSSIVGLELPTLIEAVVNAGGLMRTQVIRDSGEFTDVHLSSFLLGDVPLPCDTSNYTPIRLAESMTFLFQLGINNFSTIPFSLYMHAHRFCC